jgi:release factor glutamine methyltransferase
MEQFSHANALAGSGAVPSVGLGRHGTPQHGLLRRLMHSFIFFFSYHLILNRRAIRTTRAAGFRLRVRPTVFHPRYFLSSEYFAEFIDSLDLTGKSVADVGTGSGVLALAAARAGAAHVLAIDINPNAAISAMENAQLNGFGDRVTCVCMNLLSDLPPDPIFDVILSSPPKHAGEPRDITDRGWHAGPQYRDVANLFAQARVRLRPDGRLYVMLASDCDLDFFSGLINEAGLSARLLVERSFYIESMLIYELRKLELEDGAAPEGEANGSVSAGKSVN